MFNFYLLTYLLEYSIICKCIINWNAILLTPSQVPSYISRSVAGSYDNEAVAIFALIFTFYLYVKVIVLEMCFLILFFWHNAML